jgi:signal transduction histidine kinase
LKERNFDPKYLTGFMKNKESGKTLPNLEDNTYQPGSTDSSVVGSSENSVYNISGNEAMLKSNYELLRVAGETARFGGWSLNKADNKVLWSDVVAEIHGEPAGYTPTLEEAINFMVPEWTTKIRASIHDCVTNGIPFDEEMQIKDRQENLVWIRVTAKAVKNQAGEISGLQGSIQDITEQKVVKNSLMESENRLRELNATKDKFFSIIAHDLRSPFYTIMGFCSILSEQVKAKDYEGVDEYAEIIQKSSQKAMDLLKNLLEWSISQTGRMVFNPENLDVYLLLHETIELLKDSARQKSISIELKSPQDIYFTADKAMLSSVLRNLLSNAIKFSRLNGSIILSVDLREDEILFAVSDNGIGMNDTERAKLFRIDEAHATKGTRKEEGTGLGLILCKEFVTKHGGNIWVESEPGNGSTFFFTLPDSPN